ncbi:MAG: glycosyltransferase, partial [Verrucomicrobiota bacterium]|nr:glycosyltransferase [Verrucomicrobiota bacterium]
MQCLLVIPAFRENDRLPPFLRELMVELERAGFGCDVLVVDDGSSPGEQRRLEEWVAALRSRYPRLLKPLFLPRNRGKGGAVRAGWEQLTTHEWVGFVDADGAIPVSEVCRLLRLALESPAPSALFATRVKMLGKSIERSELRHLLGRIFALLVDVTISPNVYDSQCGLKLIRSSVYQRIESRLHEDGFCFDVELLGALLATGAEVIEVPIDWKHQPGSKLSLLRESYRMFRGVLRIR